MKLHPASARLRRYVLDEADAAERLLVEEHLGTCARCRAFVAQQAQLDEWLVESCAVPDQPQATRVALDRLWAEVDRTAATPAPPAADEPCPEPVSRDEARRVALRRAAAWLLPALAAGVAAVLLSRGASDPQEETPSSPPPVARHDLEPRVGEPGAQHGGEPKAPRAVERGTPQTPAGTGDAPSDARPDAVRPPEDPAERLDPARLAAARATLSTALLSAHKRFPDDGAPFAAACAGDVSALRSDGWPVQHLLRGLAAGPDPTLVTASLRWAARDATCAATLADALARPAWTPLALDLLAEAPATPPASGTVAGVAENGAAALAPPGLLAGQLVAPLAALAEQEDPALPLAQRVEVMRLLVRARSSEAGAAAATAALERVLQRCLDHAAAPGLAGAEAATPLRVLAAVAPADLAVAVLLQRGKDPAARAVARDCFAALARHDEAAWTAGAARVLATASPQERSLLAEWAAPCGLRALAPPLLAALRADPDQPELALAVARLGGSAAVRTLWDLVQAERGRTSEVALRAGLLAALAVDDAAIAALAPVWTAARSADAVALAEGLPPERRGALLLSALEPLGGTSADLAARERLLTGLARLGAPADGARLLAWIDAQPRGDRVLALAWTTAFCLSGTEARAAWARGGRDPDLLASAAGERGAWPSAAPAPPSRALRTLDQSLRRAPPRAAPAPIPASKETL